MTMDDDSLWTIRELAMFLRYTESSVRTMASKSPERLPPRVAGLGRPRWSPATVRAWVAAPAPAARARAGRPRINPAF